MDRCKKEVSQLLIDREEQTKVDFAALADQIPILKQKIEEEHAAEEAFIQGVQQKLDQEVAALQDLVQAQRQV